MLIKFEVNDILYIRIDFQTFRITKIFVCTPILNSDIKVSIQNPDKVSMS